MKKILIQRRDDLGHDVEVIPATLDTGTSNRVKKFKISKAVRCIGLVMLAGLPAFLAGLLIMIPKASAGCSHESNSSYGYDFLEIMGGKISLYDDKVTLNVNVKFARRSYGGCAYSFQPIKRDTAIKVSCRLSRNDDITLKGKLADTMDAYAYEGMIIGKITKQSTIDDIATYLDEESSRIRCGILGNNTIIKVKIADKR